MSIRLLAGIPLVAGILAGACGTIGPPIPPEDVGLAARIRADEEKAAKAAAQPKAEEEEELPEEELAPLYPIGTR